MKIKIGFILNSYTYGGAEKRIKMLHQHLGDQFEFIGLAAWEDFPVPESFQIDIPMWIGEPFKEGVDFIAKEADIIISSCKRIGEFIPPYVKGKIIGLSQCGGEHSEIKKTCTRLGLMTKYCVANSENAAEPFSRATKKSKFFKIIHNGFDPSSFGKPKKTKAKMRMEWDIPETAKVVGYVGRIAKDKGVDRLAKSLRHLPDNWYVVFYGKNSNFETAENQFCEICEEEIPGRYRICEWTDDVASVLKAIDVFCLPSEFEGFSNSLAEAWIAGTPTVYTKGVGATAELGRMGTEIPPDATPQEIAQGIKDATNFISSRLTTYAAQKAMSKFSIKNAVDEWRQYLISVHEDERQPKAILISPNLSIGGAKQWLMSLLRHSNIDFRCVFMSGEDHRAEDSVIRAIQNFGVDVEIHERQHTRHKLSTIVEYTNPDCIIAWGVHDLDHHLSKVKETFEKPIIIASHGNGDSEWTKNLLKSAVKACTHYTAVSPSAVDPYPEEFQDKVKVINNGIEWPHKMFLTDEAKNECRERMKAKPGDIVVGFLGRLSLEKNPYILACAMNELPDNWKARFIGPAYYAFDKQVENISKKCMWIPPFPLGDTYKWLPGFDVLCVPSVHESFCLVTVEAWACGVPVCMTDVGVSKQVEEDVMVRVPNTCDPKTLALGIVKAYYEAPKRINLARRVAKDRFSATGMAAEWSEYIKDVCKS